MATPEIRHGGAYLGKVGSQAAGKTKISEPSKSALQWLLEVLSCVVLSSDCALAQAAPWAC